MACRSVFIPPCGRRRRLRQSSLTGGSAAAVAAQRVASPIFQLQTLAVEKERGVRMIKKI
ncbi:hypothetical protein SESBI_45683 [Sesbania bispinosa]|nr:hypothetical protein SESBI_45683 [Sesbania bispinosa]